MYSTRNSTQYSVMTYMGKESKKEWIYLYVTLVAEIEEELKSLLMKVKEESEKLA